MYRRVLFIVLFLIALSCKAQILSLEQYNFIEKIYTQSLQQEIIGSWIHETDTKSKWIFHSNGELKSYYDNQLIRTSTYSISHSCGTNSEPNFYFLKITDEDNDHYCFEINGVNVNNSGILSLTSMENGKIFLYNKQ